MDRATIEKEIEALQAKLAELEAIERQKITHTCGFCGQEFGEGECGPENGIMLSGSGGFGSASYDGSYWKLAVCDGCRDKLTWTGDYM